MVLAFKKVLTDASDEVESASYASISAERDQPLRNDTLFLGLSDALIVGHSDLVLKKLVEQPHVVRLCLDRVREEKVSLVRDQVRNRHFFYSKDHGGF